MAQNNPDVELNGTPEEIVGKMVNLREKILEESKRLSLLRESGLIARKYAAGCVSCEFFSRKNWKMYNLVQNNSTQFFTNGLIYDEQLALNLAKNKGSSINLSLDSGTNDTWRKIKGTGSFDIVLRNLERYLSKGALPKQFSLKYIMLPGINDNLADYSSLIVTLTKLGVDSLTVSRDMASRDPLWFSSDSGNQLLVAVGNLVALLHQNGIKATFSNYSESELNQIIEFARNDKQ